MSRCLFYIVFLFPFSIAAQDAGVPQFNAEKFSMRLNDSISDIDGNIYHTQKMGEQVWMIENLKVKHYNNGDIIPVIADSAQWYEVQQGAICNVIGVVWISYEEETGNNYRLYNTNEIYYNQFAVMDERKICPAGWRIPDTTDWNILEKEILKLHRENFKDQQMKWESGKAKNGFGFSEFPFGFRIGLTGEFISYNDYGYWWSTAPGICASALGKSLLLDDIHQERRDYHLNDGMSVKCIKE